MKIKIRGKDFDYVNSTLEGKDVAVFVGVDCEGKEIYTGDIVTKDGEEFRVELVLDFDFIPSADNLQNYKLKG